MPRSSIFNYGNNVEVPQAVGAVSFACGNAFRLGEKTLNLGVQQIQLTVQRTVTQLFEIGSVNYYYMAGRSKGQGTLQNVIGPAPDAISGMSSLGNICTPSEFTYTPGDAMKHCTKAIASTEGGLAFTGAVLSSVGITAVAETDMVTGNWGFMFADVQSVTKEDADAIIEKNKEANQKKAVRPEVGQAAKPAA